MLCLEIIKSRCNPLLIASIYRPSNTTVDTFDKIHDFIRKLDSEDKDFVMVGDLNCDFLEKNKISHAYRLNDMLELFQIKRLITEPTRITELNTETLVDLFMANAPEKICSPGVEDLGISDHSLIYGCRKISFDKSTPKVVEVRNDKNYISSVLKNNLARLFSQCDWEIYDPNTLWEQFKAAVIQTAEIHAPIRLCKVSSDYASWVNEQIKKAIIHRDYLKKKIVKMKSKYLHQAYKRDRNRINKLIRNTKKTYYKNTIDKNKENPKQMWKTLINVLVGF